MLLNNVAILRAKSRVYLGSLLFSVSNLLGLSIIGLENWSFSHLKILENKFPITHFVQSESWLLGKLELLTWEISTSTPFHQYS